MISTSVPTDFDLPISATTVLKHDAILRMNLKAGYTCASCHFCSDALCMLSEPQAGYIPDRPVKSLPPELTCRYGIWV